MTNLAPEEYSIRTVPEIEGEFRTFTPEQIKTQQCLASAVSLLNDPAHDEEAKNLNGDEGPLSKAFSAASDALRSLPTARVYYELISMSRKGMSEGEQKKLQTMLDIMAPKTVHLGIQS